MPNELCATQTDLVSELLRQVNDAAGDAAGPSAAAMRVVARAFQTTTVMVYAPERGASLRLVGAHGIDGASPNDVIPFVVSGRDVAARCVASGVAVLSDRTRAATGSAPGNPCPKRFLHGVPIVRRGETSGAVVFANDTGDERLSPNDDTEKTVLGVLALALEGPWRAPSTSITAGRLERTLSALHELAERLAGGPFAIANAPAAVVPGFDLREFFVAVAERARELVDAEMAAIGVGTSPDQPFDPWVAVGAPEGMARAVGRHPRPVGALGDVAVAGRTVRTDDLPHHPSFRGLPAGHADVRSLLALPIRIGGRSMGNLYLANKRGGKSFDDADQRTIEMFAALAATGLRLATLLRWIDHDRTTLRRIIEAEPDGIAFVDASSERVLVNRAFEDMVGERITSYEAFEQQLRVLRWPDGSAVNGAAFSPLEGESSARTTERELLITRDDGKRIPVRQRVAAVRDTDDKPLGSIVVLRDISLEKDMERLREEFAAMVAHDLRNPIQSILIQVQMLRRLAEDSKPPPSAALDRLERLGARLAQMAGDLLDTTRIELARIPLVRVSTDIVEATRALIDRVRPTIGDHRIELHVEPPIPHLVLDPVRFDQILTNLLENSGKYSASGTRIDVCLRAINAGVELAVADRGPGIAPAELPKLFDRFYQTKRARAQKSGLGLGLYITKGFVDAHGGHITVESTVGRGSTFRVWFPTAVPSDESAEP